MTMKPLTIFQFRNQVMCNLFKTTNLVGSLDWVGTFEKHSGDFKNSRRGNTYNCKDNEHTLWNPNY